MSYEPTNWKKGDKVTSTRLNKIEQGIQGNDSEITELKEGLSAMSTATSSDVGKALKAKTVTDGKVTDWEFGEAGGTASDPITDVTAMADMTDTEKLYRYNGSIYYYDGSAWTEVGSGEGVDIPDNSVTYEKLQKNEYASVSGGGIVDFWFYNNTKRTDGKSIEYVPNTGYVYVFDYDPSQSSAYTQNNITFVSDSDGSMHLGSLPSEYDIFVKSTDTTEHKIYIMCGVEGKLYLTHYFANHTYYTLDTVLTVFGTPLSTDFLKNGWEPDIMRISAKKPMKVTTKKWYSSSGGLQSFGYTRNVPSYYIPYIGWYKVTSRSCLLDENWNFIKSDTKLYFYNDGTYSYVQSASNNTDCNPVYVGHGISSFGDLTVRSLGDQQNINKPLGNAIVCFGDSITSTGYPSKLNALADCFAINMGGSGNSSGRIRKVVTGIGSETGQTVFDWSANPVDTAIVMAGWNDPVQGTIAEDVPTSNISDASNDWDAYLALFDTSATTANIAFMIEWIQVNHPDVRILLCNYHNSTFYPTRCADVDACVKALSEYYGIQMIDVRRTSGINEKNKSTYLTDGLHPNDAGQVLIAKAIIRGM